MEAKITSESKELCKEWKSLTCKTCSHINQKLWLKGWLIVGFWIIIIWLLAHIWHEREDRFERWYGQDFGGRQESMMQGRAGMMWFFWDENQQDDQNNIQWCMQQATVEIDPQNPNGKIYTAHQGNCPFLDNQNNQKDQESNSFFGRMESKMKQFFGVDKKWVATWTIATWATK